MSIDSAAAKRLDLHLQGRIDRGEIPGCTTHVWLHDELYHSNALGWSDVGNSVPMSDQTICRLASMTKPIASLALMQCYEAGLIQLNDPVSEFVPSFADLQVHVGMQGLGLPVTEPCRRPITVHDLLTHQSGLPAGRRSLANPAGPRPATLAEMVAELSREALLFQPGTRYSYGVSTDVVGHLVEIVTGTPLDAYLRENILGPLGMPDTSFGVAADQRDRLAVTYMATDEGLKIAEGPFSESPPERPTYFSGAGGLMGTAIDYGRFARMLGNRGTLDGERVISRKTLELMTRNHLLDGHTLPEITIDPLFTEYHGIGFGLGFGIMVDPARAQLSGSPGEYFWTGAFGSLVFVDPSEDLAVVFMTQALPFATSQTRLRNPYGWRELRALVYALLP
jgi:CubicO group peptidase (beta-lactamase class C family)